MHVVRETDVEIFYDRVREFLMRDETTHNIMLGMLEMKMRGLVYMAYAEQDGEIVAVLTRLENYRYSISRATDATAIKALVYATAEESLDVPGIFGPKEEADRFAGVWCVRTGQSTRLNRSERVYRLDTVIPARPAAGSPRALTEADEGWLLDWWIAFVREAEMLTEDMPRETFIGQIHRRVTSPPDVLGVWAWEVDGVPVSMAGYQGPTPNTIRLGPVYTPPEARGHGYASALCAALTQWLLDNGRKAVTLYTDLANPTSNHIYQTIGYMPIRDVSEHNFSTEEQA